MTIEERMDAIEKKLDRILEALSIINGHIVRESHNAASRAMQQDAADFAKAERFMLGSVRGFNKNGGHF